ncbi:MAG: hypothetical protein AB1390_03410 [Nitrospirota bacterium]
MKYTNHKFFAGILVIIALLLMFHQYVEGVIGDSGKPGPDLKQSLLQEVEKINKEIKNAEAKLNKAKDGDDLFKLTLTKTSVPNLKNQMNNLSKKIAEALKSQRTDKTLLMLSNDAKQATSTLNNLEQKAKANTKSGSMEMLRKLSAEVRNLQSNINKLGPQPEPPDKGTKSESSDVNKTGGTTPSKSVDVERKIRYDRGVKETGGGVGSSGRVSPPGPERPPKPKDDPASRGEMVETDRTPGVSESSPAPDGPIVGPGDPEKDVKKK